MAFVVEDNMTKEQHSWKNTLDDIAEDGMEEVKLEVAAVDGENVELVTWKHIGMLAENNVYDNVHHKSCDMYCKSMMSSMLEWVLPMNYLNLNGNRNTITSLCRNISLRY